MTPKILFHELTIDSCSKSSGVFKGTNLQIRWSNYEKVNEGQGIIGGDKNRYGYSAHFVRDRKHSGG